MSPVNRNDELFQLVKPIIDKAMMSDQDKALVLNSLWTQDQVPEITSENQYDLYFKLQRELILSARLPDRNDPTFSEEFLAFTRSPAGVLADAYGARMMEWETKQQGNAESKEGF